MNTAGKRFSVNESARLTSEAHDPRAATGDQQGLVYCNHDGIELAGDLYLPQGDGPFPILVGAPGGGWRFCARASLRQWGFHLAARGYGFFAIDYRVATATRKAFPEAVLDVIAAVSFVRGSASSLSINPQRIGLLGASAGATLAALAALAYDKPAFVGYPDDAFASVSSAVKVLVGIYGIYDLFKLWQDDLVLNRGSDGNLVRNLIGEDPFEDQQAYFDASPIRHVSYVKNSMPVFLTWGTADDAVSPEQSEMFVRALQQARFNVRTYQRVGASHYWFDQPIEEPSSDSASLAPRLIWFLKASL
jgi:acetyl esterase/lipase